MQANTLILIKGTANCGKSSLCKALNVLDNSYKIISQDDINRRATYEICENVFPEEMAIIRKTIKYENMWQAIKCFNIVLIEELDEQEKQIVIDAINRIRNFFDDPMNDNQWMAISIRVKYKVMEQLLFYAAAGYNIILDSWGVTNWDHELTQLEQCFDHIIRVVAYCSLETVVQRWQKRNEVSAQTNNHEEQRFFGEMLGSFFGFLQPAIDGDELLVVAKKDFDVLVERATQYIKNLKQEYPTATSFSFHEFTLDELATFTQKIYIKFGFELAEYVRVRASTAHDILLCTESESVNCAYELLKKIHDHNSSSAIF